jgi:outer membrane protein W
MRRIVIALLLLLPLPAGAAGLEVSIRHVVAQTTGDAGDLDLPLSRGFGASAGVFWTDRFSTNASVMLVNPEAILFPSNPPAEPVDLGTLGLNVYSLTGRWHIATSRRLGAYVGAGGAIVAIGNLDDQFGDQVYADFENETTFVVEGGLRYRFRPHIFFELGAMYVPLDATPRVQKTNVPLPETLGVDPVMVSIAAGWRF